MTKYVSWTSTRLSLGGRLEALPDNHELLWGTS